MRKQVLTRCADTRYLKNEMLRLDVRTACLMRDLDRNFVLDMLMARGVKRVNRAVSMHGGLGFLLGWRPRGGALVEGFVLGTPAFAAQSLPAAAPTALSTSPHLFPLLPPHPAIPTQIRQALADGARIAARQVTQPQSDEFMSLADEDPLAAVHVSARCLGPPNNRRSIGCSAAHQIHSLLLMLDCVGLCRAAGTRRSGYASAKQNAGSPVHLHVHACVLRCAGAARVCADHPVPWAVR